MYCEVSGLSYPTGLCDAGYYCPDNQTTATPTPLETLCPVNHYCPEGSAAPQACPLAQSQPEKGQATCNKCIEGYYCQGAAVTICPPHHYCPNGKQNNSTFKENIN